MSLTAVEQWLARSSSSLEQGLSQGWRPHRTALRSAVSKNPQSGWRPWCKRAGLLQKLQGLSMTSTDGATQSLKDEISTQRKTIAEQLRAIPVTKELMGDLTAARKAWCEQGGKENISFCKPTAAAPRMSVQ